MSSSSLAGDFPFVSPATYMAADNCGNFPAIAGDLTDPLGINTLASYTGPRSFAGAALRAAIANVLSSGGVPHRVARQMKAFYDMYGFASYIGETYYTQLPNGNTLGPFTGP